MWWARRILRPLPLLMRRVNAVAKGNLASRPVVTQRNDELGDLSREFERMVEALAVRGAKLQEALERQRQLQDMQQLARRRKD